MNINDSFVFYGSWWENIHNIYGDDITTCKELIYAINMYGMTGEKTFPCERMFLMQCYSQIDSAQAKWIKKRETNRENGKKGGRPKNKPNGFSENPNKPNGFSENHSKSISARKSESNNTSISNSNSNYTSDSVPSLTEDGTEENDWSWLDKLEKEEQDV